MDDINRLVSELCALIERMPGVTVQSSHVTSALLAITLSVTTIKSVGPLAYASSGANIRINLWTTAQGIPREDQENAAHLRFEIIAKDSDGEITKASERFEWFGVYLVRYLHDVGRLSDDEVRRLLTLWKGLPKRMVKPGDLRQ